MSITPEEVFVIEQDETYAHEMFWQDYTSDYRTFINNYLNDDF